MHIHTTLNNSRQCDIYVLTHSAYSESLQRLPGGHSVEHDVVAGKWVRNAEDWSRGLATYGGSVLLDCHDEVAVVSCDRWCLSICDDIGNLYRP